MERVQKRKATAKVEEQEIDENPAPVETIDVTDVLDDIDDILEENAEQFVASYVQQGGE